MKKQEKQNHRRNDIIMCLQISIYVYPGAEQDGESLLLKASCELNTEQEDSCWT